MDRLKDRQKASAREDLGYQVEVLRASCTRRAAASRPGLPSDGADIGYQAEQLLRNAQIQADQLRADAERELREARARAQRILQEHAEQHRGRPSCTRGGQPAPAARPGAGRAPPTVETHVNENVQWAEQLRARTEQQARRLLERVPCRGRPGLGRRPRARPPGSPPRPAAGVGAEAERRPREARGAPAARAHRTPSGC